MLASPRRSSTVRRTLVTTSLLLVATAAGCGGSDPFENIHLDPFSDTTPPAVTRTTPAAGATDVATDASVSVTFSETMQPSTVSTATFTLADSAGALVTGTVTYSDIGNPFQGGFTGGEAVFVPASPLLPSSTYRATVTTGAHDRGGNPLTASHSWTFTTRAQ